MPRVTEHRLSFQIPDCSGLLVGPNRCSPLCGNNTLMIFNWKLRLTSSQPHFPASLAAKWAWGTVASMSFETACEAMVCYPGPIDPSAAEHKTGENPHVTDWTQMPTDAQRNHIKSLLSRDKGMLGTSPTSVTFTSSDMYIREKHLPPVQAVDNPVTAVEPTP